VDKKGVFSSILILNYSITILRNAALPHYGSKQSLRRLPDNIYLVELPRQHFALGIRCLYDNPLVAVCSPRHLLIRFSTRSFDQYQLPLTYLRLRLERCAIGVYEFLQASLLDFWGDVVSEVIVGVCRLAHAIGEKIRHLITNLLDQIHGL
jgi:hypothetical protein